MAKKQKEEIIISNTPLEPTTIGVIETKENGPIFTIIWIIIFIAGIFLLPHISTWIQEGSLPSIKDKPKDPIVNNVDPGKESEEIEYYELKNNLKIKVEEFQFQNFEISENDLKFQILNQGGKTNFFEQNKYFIELYTEEKLLLQRFKVPSEEVITTSNMLFERIQNINETPYYVALVKKEEKDYPPVPLGENVIGNPILTCKKENQTLVYEFQKEEDKTYLFSIKESNTFTESTTSDYVNILEENTLLNGVYNNTNGLKSELVPIRNGFTFTVTIDLKNILSSSLNRYFKNEIYYSKDTEAKTISFELLASGYFCE